MEYDDITKQWRLENIQTIISDPNLVDLKNFFDTNVKSLTWAEILLISMFLDGDFSKSTREIPISGENVIKSDLIVLLLNLEWSRFDGFFIICNRVIDGKINLNKKTLGRNDLSISFHHCIALNDISIDGVFLKGFYIHGGRYSNISMNNVHIDGNLDFLEINNINKIEINGRNDPCKVSGFMRVEKVYLNGAFSLKNISIGELNIKNNEFNEKFVLNDVTSKNRNSQYNRGDIHIYENNFHKGIEIKGGNCHGDFKLEKVRSLLDIVIKGVFLGDSCVKEIVGNNFVWNVKCDGDVNIEDIDVSKAEIFSSNGYLNITCFNMKCRGDVNFYSGRQIEQDAIIILNKIDIHGDLSISSQSNTTINMTEANVSKQFILQHMSIYNINLDDVDVYSFRKYCSKNPNEVVLKKFKFKIIDGFSLEETLNWLEKGTQRTFHTQPYQQMAKIYFAEGNRSAARRVMMELESKLTQQRWQEGQEKYQRLYHGSPVEKGDAGWQWIKMRGDRYWSWFFDQTVGYGYAPYRALWWFLGVMTLLSTVYFIAWHTGLFVPNSPVVLTSDSWLDALKKAPDYPADYWVATPIGQHYEAFHPILYTLDVFLPNIDLGQQTAWAIATPTIGGWIMRFSVTALQMFGIVLLALFIVSISGLLRPRDKD